MNSSILLVDDDPGSIQQMGRILEGIGQLRFATNGADALRIAREAQPDLVLLDAQMSDMDGFQVCRELKADPLLSDVPVIFVTSHSEAAFEVAGFESGAADFILKPVCAPLVLARVKAQLQVKRLADEMRRISTTDSLTFVSNRRQFDESLDRIWRHARRVGDPLALLMIDVDHFKEYNDCYGHPAGDTCLRSVASALASSSLRPADLVARYGGEEFVMLLPQTARSGAEHVAQCALEAVEALNIPHTASLTANYLTVSAGIACYDEESACWLRPSADARFSVDSIREGCSAMDLVRAADKAMYSAKRAGRARARLLDIADVDSPQLSRGVASRLDLARAFTVQA